MIVYVESNFILEYALRQEQYDSCVRILEFAEAGQARLVVPAFCIWEALAKIIRNADEREQFRAQFQMHLRALKRTPEHSRAAGEFEENVQNFLVRTTQAENTGLYSAVDRLTRAAEIASLTPETLTELLRLQADIRLKLPDATVLATVLQHLVGVQVSPRCFVSRDKHFGNVPEVKALLERRNCTFISSFDDAHRFIVSQLKP